MVRSVKKIINS